MFNFSKHGSNRNMAKFVDFTIRRTFCSDNFRNHELLNYHYEPIKSIAKERESTLLNSLVPPYKSEFISPFVANFKHLSLEASNKKSIMYGFLPSEGTLSDYIKIMSKNTNALPEKEAIIIFNQISLGVLALTKQGVLHQSLSPKNILFFRNEKEVLFQVKNLGRASLDIQYDKEYQYLSPEEIINQSLNDEKSIVWALGIIMDEILYGNNYFYTNHYSSTIKKIQHLEYQRPQQNISSELHNLIKLALIKEKSERISLNQLCNSLKHLDKHNQTGVIAAKASTILQNFEKKLENQSNQSKNNNENYSYSKNTKNNKKNEENSKKDSEGTGSSSTAGKVGTAAAGVGLAAGGEVTKDEKKEKEQKKEIKTIDNNKNSTVDHASQKYPLAPLPQNKSLAIIKQTNDIKDMTTAPLNKLQQTINTNQSKTGDTAKNNNLNLQTAINVIGDVFSNQNTQVQSSLASNSTGISTSNQSVINNSNSNQISFKKKDITNDYLEEPKTPEVRKALRSNLGLLLFQESQLRMLILKYNLIKNEINSSNNPLEPVLKANNLMPGVEKHEFRASKTINTVCNVCFQICHENCYLNETTTVGDPYLYNCAAFFNSKTCSECKEFHCGVATHVHQRGSWTGATKEDEYIIDKDKLTKISSMKQLEQKAILIAEIEDRANILSKKLDLKKQEIVDQMVNIKKQAESEIALGLVANVVAFLSFKNSPMEQRRMLLEDEFGRSQNYLESIISNPKIDKELIAGMTETLKVYNQIGPKYFTP